MQPSAALEALQPVTWAPILPPARTTRAPRSPSPCIFSAPCLQAAAATDKASAVVATTKDGVVLDPAAVADRRTAAEKRAEEHFLKYEEVRNRKAAAMSHRERIRDLNEKLSNLTEHNAIFNVSYT